MPPSALSSFWLPPLEGTTLDSEFFINFEHGLNPCIRQIPAALDDDADKSR